MSNFKAISAGTLIVNFADVLFVDISNNGEPDPNTATSTLTITHESGAVTYATYYTSQVAGIFTAAKYKKFNGDTLVINFDEIRLVNVQIKPAKQSRVLNITFNNGSTKVIEVPASAMAGLFAN